MFTAFIFLFINKDDEFILKINMKLRDLQVNTISSP